MATEQAPTARATTKGLESFALWEKARYKLMGTSQQPEDQGQQMLPPSQIKSLVDKCSQGNYKKWLKKISLNKVRGFQDQSIDFRFPVTALIGTNGGGKSTVLGAATLCYRSTEPSAFFPKAAVGDDSMSEWEIEIDAVDRELPSNQPKRSARFKEKRWRRTTLDREVIYIEIERTVPAGEVAKLKRFLREKPEVMTVTDISNHVQRICAGVLGRPVAGYQVASLTEDPKKRIYIASGKEKYSQFHFGAGEASIISAIERIEEASDYSLVLIEEVENGQHPAATQEFVRYLVDVAKRKNLQVIFTTHSQHALNELPPEGIWASLNFNLFNGALTIESLRAITGKAPQRLTIFAEDSFAQDFIVDALRRYCSDIFDGIGVYPAGGYPNLETAARYKNQDPDSGSPAICLIDGDVPEKFANYKPQDFACLLGNDAPESIVFLFIYENRDRLSAKIRERCLLGAMEQDRIVKDIENVYNTCTDAHAFFGELGERLGFQSEITVRRGLISLFNEENEAFWDDVIGLVKLKMS